jgi:hypothetical protein
VLQKNRPLLFIFCFDFISTITPSCHPPFSTRTPAPMYFKIINTDLPLISTIKNNLYRLLFHCLSNCSSSASDNRFHKAFFYFIRINERRQICLIILRFFSNHFKYFIRLAIVILSIVSLIHLGTSIYVWITYTTLHGCPFLHQMYISSQSLVLEDN